MSKKLFIPICTFALLLLAAALAFCNLPAETAPAPDGADGAPDFSVVCTDGGTFSLSAHRGETVVINVWATWCGPCLTELPAFDRLQREKENVAVLALHAQPVTDDPAAFAAERGYAFAVAVAPDAALPASLGAGQALPYTLIVAPDGTVAWRGTGALTYEKLAALTEEAAKK